MIGRAIEVLSFTTWIILKRLFPTIPAPSLLSSHFALKHMRHQFLFLESEESDSLLFNSLLYDALCTDWSG